MQLSNTPYPRTSLKTFAKVVMAIGLSVVFVLVVFQPFGTAGFQHDYKYFLLAGYGLAVILGSLLTYLIASLLLSKDHLVNWSVLDEVIFTFCCVLISLLTCYCYWSVAFGSPSNFQQLAWFLMYSSLVALIPVGFYLTFIYNKYKEIRHASHTLIIKENSNQILRLVGKAKGDILEVNTGDLLFIMANENYVIVYFMDDAQIKKRMLRATLKQIGEQLDAVFVKCHRSYIVNKNRIDNIIGNKTNTKLQIKGISDLVPVSRSYVDQIRSIHSNN